MTLDEYLQSRGDDFVRDCPQNKEYAAKYFTNRLDTKNKKGKGLTTTSEESQAEYKIIIRPISFDMGAGGLSMIPMAKAKAGGCIMSGTAEIIETSSGNTVLSLTIDEVKGLGHVSETVRLGMMYIELANLMLKLK
ncbi:MAG: hypothetical protein IJP70_06440 [Bacteroidales bacterium]|nr:hypothetical protein [Bacteroidales bacterium]